MVCQPDTAFIRRGNAVGFQWVDLAHWLLPNKQRVAVELFPSHARLNANFVSQLGHRVKLPTHQLNLMSTREGDVNHVAFFNGLV